MAESKGRRGSRIFGATVTIGALNSIPGSGREYSPWSQLARLPINQVDSGFGWRIFAATVPIDAPFNRVRVANMCRDCHNLRACQSTRLSQLARLSINQVDSGFGSRIFAVSGFWVRVANIRHGLILAARREYSSLLRPGFGSLIFGYGFGVCRLTKSIPGSGRKYSPRLNSGFGSRIFGSRIFAAVGFRAWVANISRGWFLVSGREYSPRLSQLACLSTNQVDFGPGWRIFAAV